MTKTRIRYVCRAVNGCTRPSVLTFPIPLCRVHALEITRVMMTGEMWSVLDADSPATSRPWDREATRLAVPVTLPVELPDSHAPVVYFVQNGSLVKIGWSTNLRGRLSALCLRKAAVLLTIAGDNALEGALHRMFGDLRQNGTEWFNYGLPLAEYIQKLRSHASPVSLADLTEMLGETGSHAVADDEPEKQPRPSSDVPKTKFRKPLVEAPPRVRMHVEEARKIFSNVLEDILRTGSREFGYTELQEIPEVTGWPKGWVYYQLDEMVEQGRLDRTSSGWAFRVVTTS